MNHTQKSYSNHIKEVIMTVNPYGSRKFCCWLFACCYPPLSCIVGLWWCSCVPWCFGWFGCLFRQQPVKWRMSFEHGGIR